MLAFSPALAQAPAQIASIEAIAAALKADRLVQAERMLSVARASQSWDSEYQKIYADWAFASGKYEESLAAYKKLSEQMADGTADLGIGLSALQLNKLNVAESHLRKYVSGKDPTWRGWNGLGVLLDRQGQLKEGEDAFRRGLQLAPERETLWNNLGYCLLLQGRAEEAVEALDKAKGHKRPTKVVATNNEIALAMAGTYPMRRSGETSASWAGRLNDAGYGAWLGGHLNDARSLFARAILERETHFKIAERNLEAVEALLKVQLATP